MRQGMLRSSRYSPGNMNRESLEAVFVGRDDVMEDVLTRIAKSIRGPQKHYILLVGPRGSGKTHLLALAYHRLMDSFEADDAGDSVAVALLKEEEWGVASYLDLVVRILIALAEEAPQLHAEIADVYDRFSKDPGDAEAFAVRLLRRHSEGKTLLLLCENLVDLFHGLDDEGQKRWRAAIQQDGNWAIVATTPQLFAAVTLQNNPFYGFFTVRALEEIDLETGIDLLAKKALHESKSDLADFLRTPLGRARARAVHHLAAGNHRAYVVLFDFLDKESLEDLIDPFMHMVDDLTPYYQDRMRQLPPAQRKIMEFLCLEGTPATVKDISTSCLMSHQTAAKQIGELVTAGFVRRNRSGRNTFCELSEPLMRICIEVKDNKTQHFRLFVEFLRHWFTSRELERRHAAYQHDAPLAVLDRLHVEEAVKCSLTDRQEPLIDALHVEAQRCWDAGNYRGLAMAQETLVRDGGGSARDYGTWVYALVRAGDGQSAIAAGREGAARHPRDDELLLELTNAYFMEDQFDEALATIDQAIAVGEKPLHHCARANMLLRLERFEEAIAEAEALLDTQPDHWHSIDQIIQGLDGLGRVAEAEAHARDLVRLAPAEPSALVAAARFYGSQRRLDRALELADKALSIDADHQGARQMRGFVLFDMADYRGAAVELRQFASCHPRSVRTHCRLADSLLCSEEFEEAIEVAEHLLDIDPEHSHSHLVRGCALVELGRLEEAMVAFDELLRANHCTYLLTAASYARQAGDHEAAQRYLGRVAERDPDNRELWIERFYLYIDRGALDAALDSAKRVETLPDSSLLGRLLAARAIAGGKPLGVALDAVDCVEAEYFKGDVQLHQKAVVAILTMSVRKFGPRYLPEGLLKLRELLASLLHEGVLGEILTDLLRENVDRFAGPLDEWENALDGLATSLADLADCRIPLGMLHAAVAYSKTGDEKRLLSLPLEQRQLLQEVLPPPGSSDLASC